MTDQIRTHTDEDTSLYGGDFAVTRTIPKYHPDKKIGIRLKGTRDSIEGADIQYHTFFRGDIWFRDNPHLEFQFVLWQNDNSSTPALEESRRNYMHYIHNGFKVCKFDEWQLSEALQAIYADVDGNLAMTGGLDKSLLGGVSSAKIVMYRPAQLLLDEEAKRAQYAPTTPEMLNAEAQKRMSGALTDPGVSSRPLEIHEIAHSYVPPTDSDE